jgi:glutathione S-transferase-like protein
MAEKPTLHVCSIDTGGPRIHPCRRAHEALDAAGIAHLSVVFAKNKPFGLGTRGTRPALKELSGQEKLPVLELTDGTTINGSSKIVAWAKANAVAA